MVTQLIEHERIQTTVAKAKELRKVADRVVTYAKKVSSSSSNNSQRNTTIKKNGGSSSSGSKSSA
jgi:large subunit ribosomal protein L17